MHVYLFLPSIETGGVERNAIMVANYLVGRDVQVTVVYTRAIESIIKRFNSKVAFKQLGKKLKIPGIHPRISDAIVVFFGFLGLLRRQPKEQRSVILSFQSNVVSIIASRFSSVPVIARVSNHPSHVDYESGLTRKLSERLKRIVYRNAQSVITNAKVTSDYFRQILSVPVKTIYNPIDVALVKKMSAENVDLQWLTDKKCSVVVAVGRLATQKNFPLLIRAFGKSLEFIDAKLMILGEGDERGNIERLISELNLSGRVVLLGYKKNVHRYVSRSDLFVLSSNFEGMPNALLEAVAAGVPVISTDCLSGPSEILDEGKGGSLVAIGDEDSMAEAIVHNIRNRKQSLLRLDHAKKKLADFEFSKTMKSYEKILMKVAGV